MSFSPQDDALRRRVQELGREEAATAPHFARVLRGSRPASEGRPTRSGLAGWLRLAVAVAGVFLVAAVAWWWPWRPEGGGPIARHEESASNAPAEEWSLPTDGLLPEAVDVAGPREVEQLSRDIEGLLQP